MTTSQKPIVLLGLFFCFLLPFCLASVEYPQYNVDNHNIASSDLDNVWDVTPPVTTVIPRNSNFGAAIEEFPLLIGNVDTDARPEIFFTYLNTYTGAEWDTTLELEYTDLNITGAETIPWGTGVLFDATGDGDNELFYCGIRNNESVIVGYDWINDTPHEMWSIVLGASVPRVLCNIYDAGSVSLNHTYTPTTYISGIRREVIFFSANTSGAAAARTPIIWFINASDGNATQQDFRDVDATCTNGLNAPGVHNSFNPRPWRHLNSANVRNRVPSAAPVICSTGVYDRLYIPVECDKAPPTNGRGLMAYRMDTKQEDATFGSGGYAEAFSTTFQYQYSSPICVNNGITFLGIDDSTGDIGIYQTTASTIVLIDEDDALGSVTNEWVSDMFVGEFNSDSSIEYDDVCFFAKDDATNQVVIYCTETDTPFITDEVFARLNTVITHPLSPSIHVTAPGTSLTGDSRQEIITPMGIFTPEPSGFADGANDFDGDGLSDEEFRWLDFYLPLEGTCSGADINNDGYGDVYCVTPTNLTFYISTNINQPVDLKTVGVDVITTMCPGNQSFFVTYASGNGYVDVEEDDILFEVDCENNGTTDSSSGFQTYSTSFGAKCPYSVGTHTAQIRLEDEGSGTADTFFYTTTVSDITGCTTPDGIVSGSFDDSGDVGGEPGSTPPTDISDDITAALEDIGFLRVGTREAFWIFLLLVFVTYFAWRLRSGPTEISTASIIPLLVVVIFLGLLVLTLFGFIRSYILITTVIVGIAGSVIYSTFFGGQRP